MMQQTQNKFYCTCFNCKREDVKFDISYIIKNDGWGNVEQYTKLTFNCPDCKNEWSEMY